jgi:hypothetical protein
MAWEVYSNSHRLGTGKVNQLAEAVLGILCGQGLHIDPPSCFSVLDGVAQCCCISQGANGAEHR